VVLSRYHQKYTDQSESELKKKADVKRQELEVIFEKAKKNFDPGQVKIAVLGCGDKRFIRYHREIFESLLATPVEIFTFDITIDHLRGEENVIKHDCTLPLPEGPFDITYGHVVLRFVETDKQWDFIKNSYDSLRPGGMAIHVLDKEDYETKGPKLGNGLFSVPLDKWKQNLTNSGIKYFQVGLDHGLALLISK
jgi:SAM-dependent methyltransferase